MRSSHEAFDGSGYPDGLAGDAIPLGARVIAVCDAFDAMISNRSYSTASTIDDALAELDRCAGTQFDPAIVDAFQRVMAQRHQFPTLSQTSSRAPVEIGVAANEDTGRPQDRPA